MAGQKNQRDMGEFPADMSEIVRQMSAKEQISSGQGKPSVSGYVWAGVMRFDGQTPVHFFGESQNYIITGKPKSSGKGYTFSLEDKFAFGDKKPIVYKQKMASYSSVAKELLEREARDLTVENVSPVMHNLKQIGSVAVHPHWRETRKLAEQHIGHPILPIGQEKAFPKNKETWVIVGGSQPLPVKPSENKTVFLKTHGTPMGRDVVIDEKSRDILRRGEEIYDPDMEEGIDIDFMKREDLTYGQYNRSGYPEVSGGTFQQNKEATYSIEGPVASDKSVKWNQSIKHSELFGDSTSREHSIEQQKARVSRNLGLAKLEIDRKTGDPNEMIRVIDGKPRKVYYSDEESLSSGLLPREDERMNRIRQEIEEKEGRLSEEDWIERRQELERPDLAGNLVVQVPLVQRITPGMKIGEYTVPPALYDDDLVRLQKIEALRFLMRRVKEERGSEAVPTDAEMQNLFKTMEEVREDNEEMSEEEFLAIQEFKPSDEQLNRMGYSQHVDYGPSLFDLTQGSQEFERERLAKIKAEEKGWKYEIPAEVKVRHFQNLWEKGYGSEEKQFRHLYAQGSDYFDPEILEEIEEKGLRNLESEYSVARKGKGDWEKTRALDHDDKVKWLDDNYNELYVKMSRDKVNQYADPAWEHQKDHRFFSSEERVDYELDPPPTFKKGRKKKDIGTWVEAPDTERIETGRVKASQIRFEEEPYYNEEKNVWITPMTSHSEDFTSDFASELSELKRIENN